jgi:thioredoxin 1
LGLIAIDRDSWDEHVTNSSGWVVVDFWGPRCKPCLELMPAVEALAEKYGDKMTFCSLDTSKAMRLAIAQGVMSLPVIAFYFDGEKKEELSGEFSAEDVENKILELLG